MDDIETPEMRPTPSGIATTGDFEDDAAVRAALLAVVRDRVAAAIADQERCGLISPRGDAAATLFVDAPRVRALLDAGDAAATPLPAAATRRARSLERRLDGAGDRAPLLAQALRRWELTGDALLVFGAALAAAVAPDLARLLSYLGGDASRPGLSVTAAAALLGPGSDPVIAIERMLAPGGALGRAELVVAGPRELPFLRRQLEVPDRVLAIAAGARRPERAPVELLRGTATGPTHVADDDAARLRALANRFSPDLPVLGWIVGRRDDALRRDLHRLLSIDGWSVAVVHLSVLAHEAAVPALVREALLARAAVAIDVDLPVIAPGDAATLARNVDRLARVVPCYVINDGKPEPRLPTVTPRLSVIARPTDVGVRRDALAESAAGALTAEAIDRLAHNLPGGPDSFAGIGSVLALEEPGADPAAAAGRIVGHQRGVPVSGPLSVVPPAPPWAALDVPPSLPEALAAAVDSWRQRNDDRLVVAIRGPLSVAPAVLAARMAADVDMPAIHVDLAQLFALPPAPADSALARAVDAAGANCLVLLDAFGTPGQSRGRYDGRDRDRLVARLGLGRGLFVVVCLSDPSEFWSSMADIVVDVPKQEWEQPPDPFGV